MSDTLHYYNSNAATFFADTVNVDMTVLYDRFLKHVPVGGWVLDAGCGSGRDSRAFLSLGYRVMAFDVSPELARMASDLLGQPVATLSFEQVTEVAQYDGVWACASLLHLHEPELPDAFARLWAALKSGGVFYVSFKLGDCERLHNGRHFTDATEERLCQWTVKLSDVSKIECWVTQDQRPNRVEHWLNAMIFRSKFNRHP